MPAERTKSRRPHIVPMSEPVLAILQARASREGRMFGREGRVFSGWSWHKAQLDARSGVYGWCLHDARRLLATSCAEKLDPPVEPWVIEGRPWVTFCRASKAPTSRDVSRCPPRGVGTLRRLPVGHGGAGDGAAETARAGSGHPRP